MKNENQLHLLKARINRKRRRKWYYTASVTMAAIVVFCSVYALILPAITLEKKQEVLDCPLSVHQHTAECRDENGTLICGQADFVIHTHNESCYNAENELVCKLPEIAAHAHTDACYEVQQVLICTNEAEEHTHDDACYQTEETLTCKETAVLHTHDDTCYDENGTLICGMLQVTEHVHGDACFQTVEQAAASGFQPGVMPAADTNATWGYNEDGSIFWTVNGTRKTANRISTASAPRTVINLFDYWVTDGRYDPDNVTALANGGINNGHAFRFSRGDNFTQALNHWVGSKENPLQGIVKNVLSESGYPVLSGTYSVDGYDSQESLEYLFNPSVVHEGKSSYRNVSGLLAIDGNGYYSFDSSKHMAEFDEESNSFRVYDQPRISGSETGGFYPFNQAPQIMASKRDAAEVNHYFGVTITTRFIQLNGGHTDMKKDVDMIFEFSGDDDVWIFVDDVLVGDVGGIHDASTVSINFATGEVSVKVNAETAEPLKTSLYKQYQNADKEDTVNWVKNEKDQMIFADDTSHTLKFFYLERGNWDSNMRLKYNLTEIPVSSIGKVDQYGDAVPGATFTAYAANGNYEMLDNKDGDVVKELPEDWKYDSEGNIVDSNGNILVHALYTGTTGVDGMMIFAKPDGKLYSIEELRDTVLGTHFILRETQIPDGYRIVNKDAHLQIWEGESQKIIKCDNTPQSGVRASSNLQITATDTLYLRRKYDGNDTVQYYNTTNGDIHGTLFAVVFRYVGELSANGDILENEKEDAWVPVYGNDKSGYRQVPLPEPEEASETTRGLVAALQAAKESAKMNGINSVVFHRSAEGSMQLTMEHLPGHITTYYRMLSVDEKSKARYTVAYYWTDRDSLEQAAPENTYRVFTFKEDVTDSISYSGFERTFGADIQVPNLINKVFVQKMDESNTRINGATFAIYQVQQVGDTIQYLSPDGKSYAALPENAVIKDNGVITAGGNVIVRPLKTAVTRDYEDGIHVGTAEFTNLSDGQYIIKEVNPPPGYKLNTADVMVLVTEDTIYANAGTEDDGITVGRGPGYLINPLTQFASEGQIDNTLTWIYARMLITYPSTHFSDIGDKTKVMGYLKTNNSGETTNILDDAFKTYLIYEAGKDGTAFNYVPDTKRNGGFDSDGYRRLFTTVGWNYYAILQDYKYGLEQVKQSGANYENWSGQNLMNLFSRSTYIRITDEQETTVKVKKADAASPNVVLAGASFRLYTIAGGGTGAKLYYRWNATAGKAEWIENEAQALTVTTEQNGMGDKDFTGLKDGEYYLEEISAPIGYYKPKGPVKFTIKQARLTLDSVKPPEEQQSAKADEGTLDENNLYIYTVTVYNSTGYELPATGGSGTILYTTGGLMLMALPLVYGYRKKRRSEGRMK